MASCRARPVLCHFLLVMLRLIFASLVFPAIAVSEPPQPPPPPGPSLPAASHDDLICHTDNRSECYPSLFQPTEEFQIIRDGQILPPGLHVRLNIYTGLKEARLNVPAPGDDEHEGLPVDRSVVVVHQEQEEQDQQQQQQQPADRGPSQRPLLRDAPAYDPVGKVKPPAGGAEPPFSEAMGLLRKLGYAGSARTGTADAALEELRELSHDAYYGLMIISDPAVTRALICTMLRDHGAVTAEEEASRSRQAAYVIAGALHNNPSAVKELAVQWPSLREARCDAGSGAGSGAIAGAPLVDRLFANLAPAGTSPDRAKARVAALSSMLQDPTVRAEFLARGGMRVLAVVLARQGSEWDGAARRAGQLALDRFLDEEMGADIGIWPGPVRMLGESDCGAAQEREGEEGCWRVWAGRAMRAGRGGWSRQLWEKLDGSREAGRQMEDRHLEL